MTLPTYSQLLETHKKKEVHAKWMIMDSIKDHLIPHIFDALVSHYQSENINRKMILHNRLRSVED